MINDFMHGDIDPNLAESGKKVQLMTHFLPTYQLLNPPRMVYSIVRAYKMATEALPNLPNGGEYLSAFRNAKGLDLLQYVSMLFGVWSALFVPNEDELRTGRNLILDPATSFKNSGIQLDEWERFLDDEAFCLRDLSDHLYAVSLGSPKYDFLTFQRHPLARMEDGRIFCLDMGFLGDRMSSGVFWAIHDAVKSADREGFRAQWALAFQDYVEAILRRMYPERFGVLKVRPKKANGDELTDAILFSGGTLIMVETKGSLLTAEAKQSGLSQIVLRDLEAKFVSRGVDQLAREIRTICELRMKKDLDGIGVEAGKTREIIPVLIVLDPALETPFVSWHLHQKFLRALERTENRARVTVRPLILLTAEDLEDIEANRGIGGIFEMLGRKAREDPDQGKSFGVFASERIWPGGKESNEHIREDFERLFKSVALSLFPEGMKEGGPDSQVAC